MALKNYLKQHLEYKLVLIYSDGEFKTTFTMDMLLELQRETGIILLWNFFASNHGGGAADADINEVQTYLKNYVQNNDTSLKGNNKE